jgi:hypothetical protein
MKRDWFSLAMGLAWIGLGVYWANSDLKHAAICSLCYGAIGGIRLAQFGSSL